MNPCPRAFDQLGSRSNKRVKSMIPKLVTARREEDRRPGRLRRAHHSERFDPAGEPAATFGDAVPQPLRGVITRMGARSGRSPATVATTLKACVGVRVADATTVTGTAPAAIWSKNA